MEKVLSESNYGKIISLPASESYHNSWERLFGKKVEDAVKSEGSDRDK